MKRTLLAALLASALFGVVACGSTRPTGPTAQSGPSDPDPPAVASPSSACSTAVLQTLTSVLRRVYREGVDSERTFSAQFLITHSAGLRAAVERGDGSAARAAAHALLATGHMTNLLVTRAGKTLVDVGGPAIAPLRGTIVPAGGASPAGRTAPLASYVTSVWADTGYLAEAGGITQGVVALRVGDHAIGAASAIGATPLPGAPSGTLTHAGIAYRYTSFPVRSYPSGSARVYLLMPYATIDGLCANTQRNPTVNTLQRVGNLIYTAETGPRARAQVRRVQRDRSLLEAVGNRDPQAARLAIDALLNEHIVRIRVSVGGKLLMDVGGPYVLAPIAAPLQLHGHTIGTLVLSVQDDEGYLRLARRLAGLDVLMYAGGRLVKDSLGPMPGPALAEVPAGGVFSYRRRQYRVFTVNAQAFPSGPLTIRVLVPEPYR